MFNNKINEVMDTYIPLKKLTKKDLKLQLKPWITPGISNSIKRRDRLLRKYIKAKDVIKRKFMLDIRHLGIKLFLLFDRVKNVLSKVFY